MNVHARTEGEESGMSKSVLTEPHDALTYAMIGELTLIERCLRGVGLAVSVERFHKGAIPLIGSKKPRPHTLISFIHNGAVLFIRPLALRAYPRTTARTINPRTIDPSVAHASVFNSASVLPSRPSRHSSPSHAFPDLYLPRSFCHRCFAPLSLFSPLFYPTSRHPRAPFPPL